MVEKQNDMINKRPFNKTWNDYPIHKDNTHLAINGHIVLARMHVYCSRCIWYG